MAGGTRRLKDDVPKVWRCDKICGVMQGVMKQRLKMSTINRKRDSRSRT